MCLGKELASAAAGAISEIGFVLDELYRLKGVTQVVSADADINTNSHLIYQYDKAGNRRQTDIQLWDTGTGWYATDHTNVYTYDALNRNKSIEQTGTGVHDKTVFYDYNIDSTIDQISRYDSDWTTADSGGTSHGSYLGRSVYDYFDSGQLKLLSHKNSQNTISLVSHDYSYNDRGLLASYALTRPGDLEQTYNVDQNFQYDAQGQLLNSDGEVPESDYGPNGNRDTNGYNTGEDNRLLEDPNYTYKYDLEGNRTERTLKEDFDHVIDINTYTSSDPTSISGDVTAKVTWEGTWTRSSGGLGNYHDIFELPEDENDPDGSYTWIISNLAPGEYEIFATWPKLFARSSGFDHLGGSVDVVTSISGGADPVHIEEEVNFGADPIYATGGIFENGVAWERIAANVTVESDNNMVTVHVNTKNSDNQAASGSKLYLLADAIRIKRISSDIALTKYEYDHRNLLTRVENFSDTAGTTLANATDYYYDVLGRRVGKEHTAGSAHSAERFVLDGDQIAMIEEVDSDNNLSQTRHLWATAVDQLLAIDETSTPSGGSPDHKKTTWTLPDHQGTVKDYMGREDATEESKLLYTVQTSPFGTPVGGKAWVDQATLNEFAKVDSGSRFIYTGQYFDIETGLQYSRARYYDPATREFVSPDPIQLAGGDPNFYRRAGNSPVNATDPTGEIAILTALGIVAGITFVADAIVDYYAADAEYASNQFGGPGGGAEQVYAASRSGVRTGGKAVYNAGADAVVGLSTLGFYDASDVGLNLAVTREDINNGYGLSYGIARVSTEFLTGLGIGKLATLPGRLGKAALVVDVAGNFVAAGRGGIDIVQNGASFSNVVQTLGGAVGLGGNYLGATRSVDDVVARGITSEGHVVLGLRNQGLAETAKRIGAKHFLNGDFRQAVIDVAKNPRSKISVVLDGLDGATPVQKVLNAVDDGLQNGISNSFTNWELSILHKYGRLPEVDFIQNGQIIQNPF